MIRFFRIVLGNYRKKNDSTKSLIKKFIRGISVCNRGMCMDDFQNDLFELSKKWIQPQQPSGTLSHYTDIAGGIGILEHSSIWASSFECMNDKGELRHGLNLWIPEIKSLIEKTVIMDHHADILRQNLKDFFTDEVISPMARPYIASFVEDTESPYHWSAYADRGKGVSISFKFNDVSQMANSLVVPVVYCDKEKRDIILRVIGEADAFLKKWLGKLPDEQLMREVLQKLVMAMHLQASRFKSMEWAHEKEWRIVTFINRSEGVDERHGAICFRNRAHDIVDFIKLNIPVINVTILDLSISSVAKTYSEESWKILMKTKGLIGQVLKSKLITG